MPATSRLKIGAGVSASHKKRNLELKVFRRIQKRIDKGLLALVDAKGKSVSIPKLIEAAALEDE